EPTRVLEALKLAIASQKEQEPDFACEVDAGRADEGFDTCADSPLVRLLEEDAGEKSGTVAFGTEAPQMIQLGAEAVVFGPGNIRVAHRTDELVPIDELHKCVEIIGKAIERFCL